jgi:DNA-binding NarL/FixJ family response regulator
MNTSSVTSSVLIIEDHELLAQSLSYALQAEGVRTNTIKPESAEQILDAAASFEPGVVLLDLELGGDIGDSIPLIEPLGKLGAQVMMVTGVSDRRRLAECLEAGATGLINKSTPFDQLVQAVQEVVELGTLVPPSQRHELLAELRRQRTADCERRAPFERLTPREQHVLHALIEGMAAEKIAEDSFVSLATVRSQIRAILLKLDVNSQLAAVAFARHAGWEPDVSADA